MVIGVTGHRDLLPTEVEGLRSKIANLFDELRRQFPNTPLRVMSALAEGADRLAAQTALDAGIELHAVLPMPADIYRSDFASAESKAEFAALCDRAEVTELPVTNSQDLIDDQFGEGRTTAYANAGMFISAHCHILLALWDGEYSSDAGGTAQIIYFQHYDRLHGISESVPRSSLFLTDNESDLVYHICSSRKRPAKSSECNLEPLDTHWFTTDPDHPSMSVMPPRYVRVFSRTDEFNSDVKRYLRANEGPPSTEHDLPDIQTKPAAEQIGEYFRIADKLADQFQGRTNKTLIAIYALAVLTGLAFILYSEVGGFDSLIFVFLASLFAGIGLTAIARKRQWHRKYLDYRVLAEGLRVQYYWAAAGIRGQGQSKFAYDNFLRQRDMELGWIRNVMRVAGTLSDSQSPSTEQEGLKFAIDHWIGGDGQSGQLAYYRTMSAKRARANRLTDRLTLFCLWSGIAIATALAFFLNLIGENMQQPMIVLMGVLPLMAGIAEAYTQRKADSELTKQYQFMAHVFANARRRLDEATNDVEQREVLQGLGDAALSEHAEWILIHRERQPEPVGL